MAYFKDLTGYFKGKIVKNFFDPILTKKKSNFHFFFSFIDDAFDMSFVFNYSIFYYHFAFSDKDTKFLCHGESKSV